MTKRRARQLIKLISAADGTQKPIANRALTFRASSILLRNAQRGRLNDCARLVLGDKAASALWSKPTINYLKSIGISVDNMHAKVKQFPLAVNNRSEVWDTLISILAKLGFYEEAFRTARRMRSFKIPQTEMTLTSLFSSAANAIKRKRYPVIVLPANNPPYVRAMRLMASKLTPAPDLSKSLFAPLRIEHVNAMMQCATLANDFQMVFEKLYSKLAHVRSSIRVKERTILQSVIESQKTRINTSRRNASSVPIQTASQDWLVNRLESFQAETRKKPALSKSIEGDMQSIAELKNALPLLGTLRPDTITYTCLFDACTHRYHFLKKFKNTESDSCDVKQEAPTSAAFQDALQIWYDFHEDIRDGNLLNSVSRHTNIPKEQLEKRVQVDEKVVGSFLGTFQCAESQADIEIGMKIFAKLAVGSDEDGSLFWIEYDQWRRRMEINEETVKADQKKSAQGLILKIKDGKFDVPSSNPENESKNPKEINGGGGLSERLPSLMLPLAEANKIFSNGVIYPKPNATHLTILMKLLYEKLELSPKHIVGIYEYMTLGQNRPGVLTRLYDRILDTQMQDTLKLSKKLRKTTSGSINLASAYRRIRPDVQSDLHVLQILSSYDSPKLAKLAFVWFHEILLHWSSTGTSNQPHAITVQAYNYFFKTCKTLSLLKEMETVFSDLLEQANTALSSSPSSVLSSNLIRHGNHMNISSHTLLPVISLYVASKNPIHAVDLFEHVRRGTWGEKWSGLARLKAWCDDDVKRPKEDVKISEAIVRYAYWGIEMMIRQKRGQEQETDVDAQRLLKFVTKETTLEDLKKLKKEYNIIWKRIKGNRLSEALNHNELNEVPKKTVVGSTPKWLREKFQAATK